MEILHSSIHSLIHRSFHDFVTGGEALPGMLADDALLAGMAGLLLLNLLILCYSSRQHHHHRLPEPEHRE